MKAKLLVLISLPILYSGCVNKHPNAKDIEFDAKPVTQVPKQYPQPKVNKGSLYSMQGASLFADKKDLQVGDIIQVNIFEELDSSSDNSRDLSTNRNSSFGGGVAAPIGDNVLGNTASKVVNKFNRNLGVNVTTGSSSSDSGSASSAFSESFETTVSAIIQEIYQNGNYMIKGTKEILIEGQKQEIILTGIIRPYDISSENSVTSNQIANLKILYNKDGDEADVLETPWGTKLLRKIWPF